MRTRDIDEWTINRWRLEPRLRSLEMEDVPTADQAPPLWKDLTLASIVALQLWGAAAAVFG